MNTGDTAWVLISSALVLGMTIPGLAFFYGGLVRRKNVLSILMQCFIITCVISLQWVLFGYSLAFGPDTGLGIIGSLKWAGLNFVGGQPNADYAATIPHQVFMIFQAMFAIITPALDHRRLRGTDEILGLSHLHRPVGDPGLRSPGALGLGDRGLAPRTSGRWISPAGSSSMSVRGSRH